MRPPSRLLAPLCLLALLAVQARAADEKSAATLTWKKTVLDTTFRAEGVAVADVNHDGKLDVLHREAWYEAPSWKRHDILEPGDYGDGAAGYSHCFACWADDLNKDGWPDLIVIDYPGIPCYWLENPQNKPGHWKQHIIWHSACNETPTYVDLLGTGRRVLLMGWQPKGQERQGQMAYFTPGKDPTQLWEMHPISEPSKPGKEIPGTFKYSHGLGAGDVNGDGKLDVLCTGGWWEQPDRPGDRPWTFHPADLGPDCADMFAGDLDGDGLPDVISSSAHRYGIWWHQQKKDSGPNPKFIRRDLFPKLFSQSHALHLVDLNGDGLKDLVTGKRWWAHGPKGDIDPNDPPVLYWFEAKKSAGLISFTPHKIDDASGIGTQFVVQDVNGDKLPDIVVSNKRGTFLFEQARVRKGARGPTRSPFRVVARALAEEKEAGGRALFNGKDLSGWDTWLGRPYKGKEVIGLNKDPKGVYSVVMEDGKPAIRISGEVFGALTSKEAFKNYHLRLEFKWGKKKWPPRDKAVRDSGLLYHCVGKQGAAGTYWMRSLEFQVEEHDCGDFWSVDGPIVEVTGKRKDGKGPVIYDPKGKTFTIPSAGLPRRIVKGADYEKPTGEWNTLELFTVGQTSVHVVNGKPNMVLRKARHKVGDKEVPLTGGKIQLQSEGAEVFYRNITIRPLDKIPAKYLGGAGG
jgi:hypothetical protein